MKKKGIGLGEAFGAVLMLVLVAMLVIIGIYMFVVLQTNLPATSVSVIDESMIMRGPIVASVSNASKCGFSGLTINEVRNASNYILTSGNWTLSATGIANRSAFTGTPWLVNYTFNWQGDTCVASQNMVTQFGTYPALVGLTGTIIFLGIVIGILVSSFAFGRRRGA